MNYTRCDVCGYRMEKDKYYFPNIEGFAHKSRELYQPVKVNDLCYTCNKDIVTFVYYLKEKKRMV